jgi:3-phenylpropionate/trans-cinnamate dioxygenase ferredoxin reductase subunit
MSGVIIVGAGQAGYQTAESLRQEGYEGPITLIGEEPTPPYSRPPLSKAYLQGKTDRDRLQFRPKEYYADKDIDLRLNTRVESIDREAKTVSLADGSTLSYEKIVLVTGARTRTLPIPGADLEGIFTLKTLEDVDQIEARLEKAEQVVVVGAGFIGLEFAAVARKMDKSVTVLEAAPRVMGRVVTEQLSHYFENYHREQGVDIVCNAFADSFSGKDGAVTEVNCKDGSSYPAQLVVVGIGVIANTELAEAAGLECANGIVVNGQCQTSDPDIYAAGDCAVFEHPFAGKTVRLESVQNASDQGRVVAASIAGKDTVYDAVPWFWSDQFDLKLQMVGLQEGCDKTVIRGDMENKKFSMYHFRGDELRSIDSINKPADHMQGRKLLTAGVSPSVEQVEDESFKLVSLLKK